MMNRDSRILTALLALVIAAACSGTPPAPAAPERLELPASGNMGGILAAVRIDEEIVVLQRDDEFFEFRISLRGDVLDPRRTSVRDRNGHRIPLADIEIGTPVGVYWRADEAAPNERKLKMIQIMPGVRPRPARE